MKFFSPIIDFINRWRYEMNELMVDSKPWDNITKNYQNVKYLLTNDCQVKHLIIELPTGGSLQFQHRNDTVFQGMKYRSFEFVCKNDLTIENHSTSGVSSNNP